MASPSGSQDNQPARKRKQAYDDGDSAPESSSSDLSAHPLPRLEGPSSKRARHEQNDRTIEENHFGYSTIRDHGRAHFGDQNYYGPVQQYSEYGMSVHNESSVHSKRLSIIDSLKFAQMDTRYESIKVAHARSCQWLLANAKYKDWRLPSSMSKHNGFFWIEGKPGAGKSTIMKYAFNEAKKTLRESTVVAFFFNARGQTLENTVEGMYRSLLKQVLEKLPRLQCVLDTQTSLNTGRQDWPLELLKELFRDAVLSLGQDDLTCYIDALDECHGNERRDVVEFFEDLGEYTVQEGISFYVCFSSRHYRSIKMEKCQSLVLEGQKGHQQDIADFIGRTLKAGTGERRSKLSTALQDKASGVFQWVVLVVDILNEQGTAGNTHKLHGDLKRIPDDLGKLFERILKRGGQDTSRLVPTLQWILYAKRPLKREELYFAILTITEPDAVKNWIDDEVGIEDMEKFILDCSRGLAEITKGTEPTVQFIHESVRTYLVDRGLKILEPGLSENLTGLSHDRLKQCCQDYIMLDTPKHQVPAELPPAYTSNAKKLREPTTKSLPFLEYALDGVLYHADTAQSHEVSQDIFLEGFPRRRWNSLNNLLTEYERGRHTDAVTLMYILAERNAQHLLELENQRRPNHLAPGETHRSALGAAVSKKNHEAVRVLLKHGAVENLDNEAERICLELAVVNGFGDVFAMIFRNGATTDNATLKQLLRISTVWDRHEIVRMLLTSKVAKVISSKERAGLMQFAAEGGHEKIVEFLLSLGVDINAQGPGNDNAFKSFSNCGHGKIIELFPEAFARTKLQGGCFGNALQAASYEGHENVVMLLLEKGADVNTQGGHHGNALLAASWNGEEKVIQLLLARGADVNAQGLLFENALVAASARGHETLVELLLDKGAVITDQALLKASSRGHGKVLELLLQRGKFDAKLKGRVLCEASNRGHDKTVQLLVSAGARVDARVDDMGTPLYAASKGDSPAYLNVIRRLLDAGASVNAQGGGLGTALQAASYWGNVDTVELLIERGAAITPTALNMASLNDSKTVVKLLLDKGAAPNQDALQVAAKKGHETIVEMLLDKGAVVTQQTLKLALDAGHENVVHLLLVKRKR